MRERERDREKKNMLKRTCRTIYKNCTYHTHNYCYQVLKRLSKGSLFTKNCLEHNRKS